MKWNLVQKVQGIWSEKYLTEKKLKWLNFPRLSKSFSMFYLIITKWNQNRTKHFGRKNEMKNLSEEIIIFILWWLLLNDLIIIVVSL